MSADSQRPTFNEQAAVDELERLREEIQAARWRRQVLSEQFDAFVRSSRQPRRAEASRAARAARPGPVRAVRDAGLVYDLDLIASPAPAAAAASTLWKSPAQFWIVGVAVVAGFLVVAAILSARFPRDAASPLSPAPEPQAAARSAPTESARPASPPPVMSSAAVAAPAGDLTVELTTLRAVWTRVLVDGHKAFERELAGGQRVPLRAKRVILVRAGDAGAIRLAVNGKDQGPLGRDGAVVTRVVTASPPGRR